VKLEAVMLTDVGVVRDHNEDSAHVDPLQRFFIVADGMGGHAAGEVASAMAVETVRNTLESATSIIDGFAARPTDNARRALVQLLQSAVLAAHQAVYQRGSKEADKAGMGTTLDVLLIAGQEAFVAHVGDSRTYLIRDNKAAQLTTDHTVAEVLVIEGKLTIEEALVSPYRTVLVNAIGVAADVGVEMAHLQLKKGDRLLLCSDGLHDYFLAEQEIADMISAGEARTGLGGMVELAKERGGHDNITGVAITIVDVGEGVPAVVETDQTQPVEVPNPPAGGWDDNERTENISPKDLDKLSAPSIPAGVGRRPADEGTRPTAPMSAVQIKEELEGAAATPTPPSGTENTDPSLNVAALDKAIAARDKSLESREGMEDVTEPALDASLVKAALARARALHGGVIGGAGGGEGKSPAVGDRAVGGEDPTLPPMPAVKPPDGRGGMGRAVTEPPPGEDSEKPAAAASDDDKTVEQRARSPKEPRELDGVATEDTGPLPRVAGDKD
jgi:serine/threonine protein phosphatase PrpC